MSSDLFVFDESSSSSLISRHSSPEMAATTDLPFFCNNDRYPFLDPLSSDNNNNNSVDDSLCVFEDFAPQIFSSSPPSRQLETLTISQTAHSNSEVFTNGFQNYSGCFDVSDVKRELFFDGSGHNQTDAAASMARSYSAVENVGKYMQRCFSSNSAEAKPGFRLSSLFDPLVESSNLHNQTLNSPENGFLAGHMRRVFSTGDLQNMRRSVGSNSRALGMENSSSESNLKVGRYSAEERRERISKYRAKRTQRNFTKTIKYGCRKTLADNRARIRGRFARNDEVVEIPKNSFSFATEDDDDNLWNLEGLHVEDHETFAGSLVQSHMQYTSPFW
ncbi:PREDICTED: uncharacterized protein LOC104809375 [Tarenaya hassleriana]|uniref:uncharacterized protein LOC104809375 n=1 Tax=Tarenaya hassleriana TaxID=28532 RepID=UPI00053CA070|nr:PREDICTED: uncharacterized protein LOC104809375 [Tarenaya hassleriana]